MDRRKFILSSVLGTGALTMFPTTTLANNSISFNSFSSVINEMGSVSLNNLPSSFTKAHRDLVSTLKEGGYIYDVDNAVKLNSKCYAISVQKKPLFGFSSNEIAFLVEDETTSKHYILEENMATEFNQLIENYRLNMESHGFNYDVAKFAFPVKIEETKIGKESVFSFKNKLNNTITIKSSRKMSRAIVC